VFLIREALKSASNAGVLHVLKDGEQAIQFLDVADSSRSLPIPSLVILDINLPRTSGRQVRHLRRSIRSSSAIVIAVSSSQMTNDREEMNALGAERLFS
jgi:DNA-binding response OmpR family regulator